MNVFRFILAIPFILIIKIYQWFISPLFPANCRFNPTCSAYAIEAIMEWGIIKGFYLSVKRIIACRPGGKHGYDPVPKKINQN